MFDATLAWILIGGLALVLLGMLLSARTPRFGERETLRFGTEIGVPLLAAGVSSTVNERVPARTTAVAVGGLIGLAACVPPLIVNPAIASGVFAWLIVPPALLAGATGANIHIALHESLFRQRSSSSRIARSTATTLRNHVSPWRLRLQPQPAADPLELAWDDAFRAETLRGLRVSQTLVASLAASAAILGIQNGSDAHSGTTLTLGIGPLAYIWGWLAITFALGYGRVRTRFRLRLVPDLSGIGSGRTREGG